MNRRERLHRCYFHQELDRPAIYVRTNWPENDPSYNRVKALMSEVSEQKLIWDSASVEVPWRPDDWRTEPMNDDWSRLVHVVHTPAGDLEEVTLVGNRHESGMVQSHLLKSHQDAEKYLSLPMPQLAGNASGFAARQAEVGDAGIVDVSLRGNPAGGVASMFGSELFAMMSVTDRSIIHSLCRHRMEVMLARLKHLLRLGVGPYFSMSGEEMIVPPLHGPVDFDDFNVRYDKPIIDLIHEAGGRVHVHSHGRIGKVIGGFLESGVDVLHPFEPPPMGDITPAEAKKAVRGRICIEGNIQIADMYERSPEQIRWHVTELIRDAFEDRRGLIISPTASLYQYGKGEMCMPQIKAMVEAVMASAQKPA